MIDKAFAKLDKTGDGIITTEDLKGWVSTDQQLAHTHTHQRTVLINFYGTLLSEALDKQEPL